MKKIKNFKKEKIIVDIKKKNYIFRDYSFI